ncbi:MAG: methyltransferase domain-containing protein, partial [Myxococcota bacterium]
MAIDPSSGGPCRFCGTELRHTFVDLGMSPLCESFLAEEQLNELERFYPLHAYVCHECHLVQLQEYVSPEEIFSEYAYFSSYSSSWLEHAQQYCLAITDRLDLGPDSLVVELASNDGYLLKNFVEAGIPVLGIEPAKNVAEVAREKGVPTRAEFFGEAYAEELARDGLRADLVIGNNVLAQVPDLNSFVAGISILLEPDGVVTLEFPHLIRTIQGNQFDQVYHEHFSYFSLVTVEKIFARHGLEVFDIEPLRTHGGSLRVFGKRRGPATHRVSDAVGRVRQQEIDAGLLEMDTYAAFSEKVKETKRNLVAFLIEARRAGSSVAAYGAPGKGNTLLNYCGIRTDLLDYCVDRNPYKHGRYTPGTHIPIFDPSRLEETRPDTILIRPWNLKDEIVAAMNGIGDW